MLVIQSVFGFGWTILSQVFVPGTNFTFAQLLVFIVVASIGFTLLFLAVGARSGGSTSDRRDDK